MRKGWTETTLDGIAEYLNGYPFKPSDLGEVGTPVVRIKQLLDPNEPLDRAVISIPQKNVLKDGDIVFSWSGTLAVRIWNRGPAFLNQHLFKVVERKGVTRNYLPLVIEHAIEELEEKSHGTTMKHITKQTLLPHKINLPPLKEQKRIVDLISSVDTYIDALQHQADSARKSRNAVLHEMLSAGGDGWTKTTIGEESELVKRGQAPSYTDVGGVQVINQKCVRNGRLNLDFARRTDSERKSIHDWAYLQHGDTLINSTGTGTLGRASCIKKLEERSTVDSHITIVRPSAKRCHKPFIGLFLNSIEKEIELLAGGSTGQTELSRESINAIQLDLPPIGEQVRIVEIISSMDDAISAAEVTIAETKKLRSGLLSNLLSGNHEIPDSYDKIIGAA